MKDDLKDKKLLILGANPETIPLVEVANELRIKTFVASNLPDEPAKKYAYEACDVDGMDVSGLIALVREKGIDGVLVGVADVLVPSYCKVCEALDLPCYATQKIVDVLSYKDVFKATCEQYGVHGVPEYYLDASLNPSDVAKIKFPVMVKPVDGCSGQGMTVCEDASELKSAVDKALGASKSKRFIVERYMRCDDVGIYYTFKDGVCSPSCVYDRYTTDEQPGLSRVCLGGTYPSKFIDRYFERMHEGACRMFSNLGIKNGVLMFSAFYEDGEFYVYDPGFRLQGEAPHLLIKAVQGFDQREMLIRFALTGSEGELNLADADDPFLRNKHAATVWFLLKEGTVSKIEGLNDFNSDRRVVANVQRLYEGDVVRKEWIGTEKQVLTRLYLVCDSKVELADAIREYREKVKAFDVNGADMLLKGFDVSKALRLQNEQ